MKIFATSLIAAAMSVGSASATTLQVKVSGVVTDVHGDFEVPGKFEPGIDYTATYLIDMDSYDASADLRAVTKFELQYSSGFGLVVDVAEPNVLEYGFIFRNDYDIVGPPVDTLGAFISIPGGSSHFLFLQDETASVFDSDSVDLLFTDAAQDVGSYANSAFPPRFNALVFSGRPSIYGTCNDPDFCNADMSITGIEITSVPLPATALLLLAGLGGLSVASSRRR